MTKMNMTPIVSEAVICWTRVEGAELNGDFRAAYNEECKLFDEYFPSFSKSDREQYRIFVKWLKETGLWKSDLTLQELVEVYEKIVE